MGLGVGYQVCLYRGREQDSEPVCHHRLLHWGGCGKAYGISLHFAGCEDGNCFRLYGQGDCAD